MRKRRVEDQRRKSEGGEITAECVEQQLEQEREGCVNSAIANNCSKYCEVVATRFQVSL